MIKVRFEKTVITARVNQLQQFGFDFSIDADVDRLGNIIALDFLHGTINPKRDADLIDLLSRTDHPMFIRNASNLQFAIDKYTNELKGATVQIDRYRPDVYANSKIDFDMTMIIPSMKNNQWVEFWKNTPTINILELKADGEHVIYYEAKDAYDNNKFRGKLEVLSVKNGIFSMSSSGAKSRKGVALAVNDTFELENVDLDFDNVPLWINNPTNEYAGEMIRLNDVRLSQNTTLNVTTAQQATIKNITGKGDASLVVIGVGMPTIDLDTIDVPYPAYHACTLASKKKMVIAPSLGVPFADYNKETIDYLDTATTSYASIKNPNIFHRGKVFDCTFNEMDLVVYTSPPFDPDSIDEKDQRFAWGGHSSQNTNKFVGCKVEFKTSKFDQQLYEMTTGLLPLDTLNGCDVLVNYPTGTDLCMVEVVSGDAYFDDGQWKFQFNTMGRDMGIGGDIRNNGDKIPEQKPSKIKFTNSPNSVRRIYSMRIVKEPFHGAVIASTPVWIWECTPKDPIGKALVSTGNVSALTTFMNYSSFGCRILACSTKWGKEVFSVKEILEESIEQNAGDDFQSWVLGGNGTIVTSDNPEVESLGLPVMVRGLMASGMTLDDAIAKKTGIDDRMRKFYRLMGKAIAEIQNLIPAKKFVSKTMKSDNKNGVARPNPR